MKEFDFEELQRVLLNLDDAIYLMRARLQCRSADLMTLELAVNHEPETEKLQEFMSVFVEEMRGRFVELVFEFENLHTQLEEQRDIVFGMEAPKNPARSKRTAPQAQPVQAPSCPPDYTKCKFCIIKGTENP